jgi:glycosyltransferase 2 family protein
MKRYLPIVIGVLLFALIFRLWKISLADTLAMLQAANWWLLLLALLAFVLMVYLKGIRWSYLLRMQGLSYPVWDCFLIYMATLYLGNLTPGRAGDFAKVFYLKQDLKLSAGKGITSVLVDRVFDLYLLLVLGGLGILMNPMPTDPASLKMILAVKVFFVILVAVTLLAFNKKIGGVLLKAAFQRLMKQEHRDKMDELFEDFHKGMEAFYKPALLVPILLSLLSYVSFFGGCYGIAQAINLPVNILYLSFCISVVNIVSLLTFLGMGTREAALIFLFGLISIGKDQAMAYSLLLLLIGVILFSLLGLICFTFKPIQLEGFSGKEKMASKPVPPRKSSPTGRKKIKKKR